MELGIPNRWVILRVERWRSMLRVSARDDRGREKTEAVMAGFPLFRDALRIATFTPPQALLKIVEGALADLPPYRFGPHGDEPVTLPVFVSLGPKLREEFDAVEPAWPASLAGRVQAVVLPPRRRLRRPPFRLPLRVLTEETPYTELARLRQASWFQPGGLVQEHGFQIENVGMEALAEALRGTPRDVVVVDADSLPDVLREAKRLPAAGARPRLLVGITEFSGGLEYRQARAELPPGISLLWLPEAAAAPALLQELFMGIIHDQPLHDAVHTAIRKTGGPALLVADPSSIQDLRLSQAVAGVRDEAVSLRSTAAGDLSQFIQVNRIRPSKDLTRALHEAVSLDSRIKDRLSYALSVEAGFGRETTGLEPLSYAEGQLAEARSLREEMETALASARRSPRLRAALRQNQERRVDVAIQSLDAVPVQAVPTTSTIRRGGLYRLRVHVGHRQEEESSMIGEPPPLDPLLPENRRRGHTLHVVVYEKDFNLLSPRVQALYLPDLGGSQPIHFDLRAPQRDGLARLRIKIYYRNQLLQSFLLTKKIAEAEAIDEGGSPLGVELAYSRTARFGNLTDFKPRLLSVGVNQEPESDRHLFMFKMGKTAEAIDLSEALLSKEIERFRKILLDATIDEQNNARFSSYDVNPSKDEFFKVIRDLADAGRALHRALQVRMSRKLKEGLRKVAQASDHTLQFVRDDPKYVFPWAILYDYGLPERRAGEAPPPVCLGGACGHGPDDKVYCVNGFWGIRHALEVLLARAGELEDEVRVVQRPARDAAIFVAVEKGDQIAEDMAAELKKDLGATVRVAREEDELLDLLWDAKERPALLVLLGHLETKKIDDELPGPRIVIFPKKRWVRADEVTDREFSKGSWTQPRTVVLLMACGSAETEVGTLNDFVTAFSSAGAAAVVGTECLVFSRLVSRFSKEMTADLLNGKTTLGEAIKTFRRRLLDIGNPLGFVFTSAGNADLVFDLKG
ncbi:MAG: CHAT domain-containing protein [Thermoanaerobaculia bacterium]